MTAATGSISGNNLNHDFKIEYNNVWNLSMERSLSSTTSFQAQYIGSYTVHADNETLQNLFPDSCFRQPAHARAPDSPMSGFQSVTWDGWEKYQRVGADVYAAHVAGTDRQFQLHLVESAG